MKKYLYIFKTQIMSNLQYTFNLLVGFAGYFVMLYILFNLWRYLYSDQTQIINGYSLHQMVWYVVITEIIWSTLGGRKLSKKISTEVKSGNVSYNINKPYNYVLYCLFQHLGDVFVKGIIYFVLGMLTGLLFLRSIPTLDILQLLFVIISFVMAISISTLLITSIGLISFFIEDASPLYWLYSKFILVLGTIFPIEFFPRIMQKILKYSPVYVVSYGPARLFVDFNYGMCFRILLSQVIYFGIVYLICMFIYKKGVKKINVNGG